jgi:transposase
MADTVGLTMEELDRLQVMTRIAERRLTRRRAAALLGLSERHVRRLYRVFTRDGAAALASCRRGRPNNRRLSDTTRERAVALLRERYADFGPPFAHQKLTEEHVAPLLQILAARSTGSWRRSRRRSRRGLVKGARAGSAR